MFQCGAPDEDVEMAVPSVPSWMGSPMDIDEVELTSGDEDVMMVDDPSACVVCLTPPPQPLALYHSWPQPAPAQPIQPIPVPQQAPPQPFLPLFSVPIPAHSAPVVAPQILLPQRPATPKLLTAVDYFYAQKALEASSSSSPCSLTNSTSTVSTLPPVTPTSQDPDLLPYEDFLAEREEPSRWKGKGVDRNPPPPEDTEVASFLNSLLDLENLPSPPSPLAPVPSLLFGDDIPEAGPSSQTFALDEAFPELAGLPPQPPSEPERSVYRVPPDIAKTRTYKKFIQRHGSLPSYLFYASREQLISEFECDDYMWNNPKPDRGEKRWLKRFHVKVQKDHDRRRGLGGNESDVEPEPR